MQLPEALKCGKLCTAMKKLQISLFILSNFGDFVTVYQTELTIFLLSPVDFTASQHSTSGFFFLPPKCSNFQGFTQSCKS